MSSSVEYPPMHKLVSPRAKCPNLWNVHHAQIALHQSRHPDVASNAHEEEYEAMQSIPRWFQQE